MRVGFDRTAQWRDCGSILCHQPFTGSFAALIPTPSCALDTYLLAARPLSAALSGLCHCQGHICLTGMGKEGLCQLSGRHSVIEMGAGNVMF